MGVHGAETIQPLLNAGLLDEIHVDLAAVLLGEALPRAHVVDHRRLRTFLNADSVWGSLRQLLTRALTRCSSKSVLASPLATKEPLSGAFS